MSEDKKFKFDVVIGNPPYQEEGRGDSASNPSIYNYFYDEAFKIGNIVEFISPGRFLFNAGSTPKKWNKKMLNDKHLKVLMYESDSSKVFPSVDIKGGVTVIYRNEDKVEGPITVFTPYPELNSVRKKVEQSNFVSLSTIITNRGLYKYSDKAYKEQEEELKKTADARIAPSAFERMPSLFTEEKPNDEFEYIRIYGRQNNKRVYRWFRRDYIRDVANIDLYKVLVPKANGSGAIGEVLSTPLVGLPLVGFTEAFISIGETESKIEAENILKYIKGKFSRAMLGILKVTQNNPKDTWKYVPLQDFTANSDIDWTKSIPEIDQQLYKKYNLSQAEIDFIESHVKEMN